MKAKLLQIVVKVCCFIVSYSQAIFMVIAPISLYLIQLGPGRSQTNDKAAMFLANSDIYKPSTLVRRGDSYYSSQKNLRYDFCILGTQHEQLRDAVLRSHFANYINIHFLEKRDDIHRCLVYYEFKLDKQMSISSNAVNSDVILSFMNFGLRLGVDNSLKTLSHQKTNVVTIKYRTRTELDQLVNQAAFLVYDYQFEFRLGSYYHIFIGNRVYRCFQVSGLLSLFGLSLVRNQMNNTSEKCFWLLICIVPVGVIIVLQNFQFWLLLTHYYGSWIQFLLMSLFTRQIVVS